MKLTMEQKNELNDFFKNKELYDPSQDPKQELPNFMPQMHGGGYCAGMEEGGEVPKPVPGEGDMTEYGHAFDVNEDPWDRLKMDEGGDVPNPETDFTSALSQIKPTTGEAVTHGLATLGDAIMQGVARAGESHMASNLQSGQNAWRQNLINALRAKYEAGYKGQELEQGRRRLNEEQRSHLANELETRHARALTERGQNLEAQRAGATLNYEKEKAAKEEAQRQADLKTRAAEELSKLPATGLFHPSSWGRSANINAAREQLINTVNGTIKIRDSQGQMHVLPAANLDKAKKRDPGLQVMQ